MITDTYTCDGCSRHDGLSATATIKQNETTGEWSITGDINIDWCEHCDTNKPRCTPRLEQQLSSMKTNNDVPKV